MSLHREKLRKQQMQILSAELATAADPSDKHKRFALAALYRKSGMDIACQAELSRLNQQFPDHPSVLTNVIKMLIDQRALRQLQTLLERAAKFAQLSQECPLELKLAIAKAYIALNQPDAASLWYATIIGDELTEDVIRQLAEFFCVNTPEFKLLRTLQIFADTHTCEHPLLLYALSKVYLYTEDYIKAECCLSHIQPDDIDTSEIAFDLAVIAFRLAHLKKAREMAQQALKIASEYLYAAEFLVSIYSFAGKVEDASKQFEVLRQLYSPLSLSCQQAEAILKYSSEQTEPEPASGVISFSNWNKNKAVLRSGRLYDTTLMAKNQTSLVTTSVLGARTAGIRPWDVLMNIDRRFPHVMVQQLRDFQIFHAFIATNKIASWPWQEVPLTVEGNEPVLDKNIFRWISSRYTSSSDSGVPITNNLFIQVEKEIKSANLLEGL